MNFRKYFVVAMFVWSFSAGVAVAQKDSKGKTPPQRTFNLKTNLLVMDASGQYVRDIKQSEIKIYEDGVEQKLTYFAVKDSGLSLAFVIDNTGSMRSQLEQVTAIGKIVTANLATTDEALVMRFVGKDKISVEQTWTTDKSLLNVAMDNLFVEGGQSAIVDALYQTVNMVLKREKEAQQKRYALLLITDGEERDSHYKLKDMFPLLENTDVQIFVIALTKELEKGVRKNSEKFALNIASKTGGSAYFLGDKYTFDNVRDALVALKAELRSQYVIGYTSTNQNDNGVPRKLTVEIADGAKGEKRKGIIKDTILTPVD